MGLKLLWVKENCPEGKLGDHRKTSEDHQTNTHLEIEINEEEHTASTIDSQH
jgi:hypothetical protein